MDRITFTDFYSRQSFGLINGKVLVWVLKGRRAVNRDDDER